MHETLGYHIVISGYGLWLPGDQRGHWSEAWDTQLGFVEPHTLHVGDPARQRMAKERQQHPPCRLNAEMQTEAIASLKRCQADSTWQLAALSVESTHTHLLMTYNDKSVDNTIKWLKDQMTKAIHQNTPHQGPVWCKGKWRSYIFNDQLWENTLAYIQRHNGRRGLGPNPYDFVRTEMP